MKFWKIFLHFAPKWRKILQNFIFGKMCKCNTSLNYVIHLLFTLFQSLSEKLSFEAPKSLRPLQGAGKIERFRLLLPNPHLFYFQGKDKERSNNSLFRPDWISTKIRVFFFRISFKFHHSFLKKSHRNYCEKSKQTLSYTADSFENFSDKIRTELKDRLDWKSRKISHSFPVPFS